MISKRGVNLIRGMLLVISIDKSVKYFQFGIIFGRNVSTSKNENIHLRLKRINDEEKIFI